MPEIEELDPLAAGDGGIGDQEHVIWFEVTVDNPASCAACRRRYGLADDLRLEAGKRSPERRHRYGRDPETSPSRNSMIRQSEPWALLVIMNLHQARMPHDAGGPGFEETLGNLAVLGEVRRQDLDRGALASIS